MHTHITFTEICINTLGVVLLLGLAVRAYRIINFYLVKETAREAVLALLDGESRTFEELHGRLMNNKIVITPAQLSELLEEMLEEREIIGPVTVAGDPLPYFRLHHRTALA